MDERFIVTSITGWHIAPNGTKSSQTAGTIWYVLDRAYCDRIVAQYGPRNNQYGGNENRARARAALLNANHE